MAAAAQCVGYAVQCNTFSVFGCRTKIPETSDYFQGYSNTSSSNRFFLSLALPESFQKPAPPIIDVSALLKGTCRLEIYLL